MSYTPYRYCDPAFDLYPRVYGIHRIPTMQGRLDTMLWEITSRLEWQAFLPERR